jgi:hypothetical protein
MQDKRGAPPTCLAVRSKPFILGISMSETTISNAPPCGHGLHGAGPHTEIDHTSESIVNYGGGSFNTNQ